MFIYNKFIDIRFGVLETVKCFANKFSRNRKQVFPVCNPVGENILSTEIKDYMVLFEKFNLRFQLYNKPDILSGCFMLSSPLYSMKI